MQNKSSTLELEQTLAVKDASMRLAVLKAAIDAKIARIGATYNP